MSHHTESVLAIILAVLALAVAGVNLLIMRRNRRAVETRERIREAARQREAERRASSQAGVASYVDGGHPRRADGRFVEKPAPIDVETQAVRGGVQYGNQGKSVTPEPERAPLPMIDPLTGTASFPGTLSGTSYNPDTPSPAPSHEPACDPPAPAPDPSPSPSYDSSPSYDAPSSDGGSTSDSGGGGGCD